MAGFRLLVQARYGSVVPDNLTTEYGCPLTLREVWYEMS